MAKVLFLHNNFPAQYRWLAAAIAACPENKVVFGSKHAAVKIPNVINMQYQPSREPSVNTHHYLRNAENAVLHGQAAFRMAVDLREKGFIPDVICAHAGWGPGHFVKEAFPTSKLLSYFEWFYHPHGTDFDFLPGVRHSADDLCRLRMKNTALLTDLNACDWGLAPTTWQHSQLPKVFQNKVSVLHDGINTDVMKPDKDAKFKIDGCDLSDVDEIVTYVARGMEEYRGFPEFIRAAQIILKQRPKTHIVVVGAERVAYGRALPDGMSFKQKMLEECDLDMSRIHFTGLLTYADLIKLFQVSKVHVYLSVPFVLSWSMLEAMSAGCLVLGSDTAPVKELIEDGKNGLLVDFFSPEKIASRVSEVLDHKNGMQKLRENARKTILERYDYKDVLPKQIQLINDIVAGDFPEQGGPYKK